MDDALLLHRFTVKPGHLDAWLALWPDEVALLRRHGHTVHRGFVETDAEPKVTLLYSHPDADAAARALASDPDSAALTDRAAPHVFRNVVVRRVRPEIMTEPDGLDRTVIMRRYAITGSWAEFLALWRRIVPLRERHRMPCLFAVADEPHDLFTWAFAFDGAWADFPAGQRAYYRDPERVALRGVFDYMADYAIHPARELPLP